MSFKQAVAAMLLFLPVTACTAGDEAEKQGNFSSGPERAKIERIVHDYILDHPEVISESFERQEERETAKVIEANRKALETPFADAWAGDEDGDVVLVQFFDYACGYCRASNADIDRLLAEDKNLKVVWREFPVLGENSLAAAKVSLAAAQQGRFVQFHKQLFAAGSPTPETLAKAGAAAGVTPQTSPEYDAELDKNNDLARALKANGTPAFVVGDKIFHGAVGYQALKDAIAAVRKKA